MRAQPNEKNYEATAPVSNLASCGCGLGPWANARLGSFLALAALAPSRRNMTLVAAGSEIENTLSPIGEIASRV